MKNNIDLDELYEDELYDLSKEELIDLVLTLRQRNKRLVTGMTYLTELAKEQLEDEDTILDSDSLILVMQVLEVIDDSFNSLDSEY